MKCARKPHIALQILELGLSFWPAHRTNPCCTRVLRAGSTWPQAGMMAIGGGVIASKELKLVVLHQSNGESSYKYPQPSMDYGSTGNVPIPIVHTVVPPEPTNPLNVSRTLQYITCLLVTPRSPQRECLPGTRPARSAHWASKPTSHPSTPKGNTCAVRAPHATFAASPPGMS